MGPLFPKRMYGEAQMQNTSSTETWKPGRPPPWTKQHFSSFFFFLASLSLFFFFYSSLGCGKMFQLGAAPKHCLPASCRSQGFVDPSQNRTTSGSVHRQKSVNIHQTDIIQTWSPKFGNANHLFHATQTYDDWGFQRWKGHSPASDGKNITEKQTLSRYVEGLI